MKLALIAASAAALLALGAMPAKAETTAEILTRECGVRLRMPPGGCDCVGKKAETELSEKEQAFVVAAITKNKARRAELQQQMTVAEMTKAGTFMTSAPGACAR